MIRKPIIGKWIKLDGKISLNEDCLKINMLLEKEFKKIGFSDDGWDVLYEDPNNEYWELIYLESELHGGGPPSLIPISLEEARKKYRV